MAYITGEDRNQMRVVAVSLDELIDQDNPVRVIDAFVNSLNIAELGLRNIVEITEVKLRIYVRICLNFIFMVIWIKYVRADVWRLKQKEIWS